MGFSNALVKWIHACISSARFSVLINGSLCSFFSSSTGLRQGDPLSPFLFILLAETFSWAIRAAKLGGIWKGIRIHNVPQSISHCLFADDTLLFGQASLGEARVKKGIIQNYASFSGQRVNVDKSKIFFLHASQLVQDRLKVFWGFASGNLPCSYLGIPIFIKKDRVEFWDKIISVISRRILS